MDSPLEAFAAEVRRADNELRLDRAALLIAAGEYADLPIEMYIARLDEIAAAVLVPRHVSPRAIAHAVRQHLFHELGFHGNEEDYYDPRNSYLNQVLLRRTGIPISLAAVFLEVARRVGLDVAGVSYPQHFLVKYRDGDQEWIVDPFHRGAEFSGEQFRAQLAGQGHAPDHAVDYYLSAVTRRQILTRMLTNLKIIYLEREDFRRALRTQEYLVALTPWSFTDIRDRGVLRARIGDVPGALADLETYLAHAEGADDAAAVEQAIARLRAGRSGDEGA